MSTWNIRQFTASDIENIIELINLVQPHAPFTEERWRWEYMSNIDYPAKAWIAEDKGKIVGLYGLTPFKWQVDGQEAKCYVPVDAMTHPDYRRMGMHAAMLKADMEHIHESGIPLCYVLPNEKSLKGALNNNWRCVFEIPFIQKELSKEVVSKKIKSDTSINIVEVKHFDAGVDRLWDQVSGIFTYVCERKAAYLNWRYVKKPDDDYRIFIAYDGGLVLGYMVYKKFDKDTVGSKSHIVDLLINPMRSELIEFFIDKAVFLSTIDKSVSLSAWMLQQAPYFDSFINRGFIKQKTERFLLAYVNPKMLSWEQALNNGNWYVTMGDSDVY